MPDPLDNLIWHTLTGPHAHLAIGRGAARRYPPDIAPFAAIVASTPAAYADLAHDLPPGQPAILFRPTQEAEPPGWEARDLGPLDQMILPALPSPPPASPKPRPTTIPLGLADVPDMLALIGVTKPGPFAPRTIELGHYIGVRDPAGRLVAMAGERLRLPGYVELSAICVHPDARGQGLAATLTLQLAQAAFARNEIPILHVWPDNPARALYIRLGFQPRATLWVLARQPRASTG